MKSRRPVDSEVRRLMSVSLRKLQKVAILFFFGIAVFAFVYLLYLDNYYHLNGAREPVPAEGKIYREFVHHGSQVFLTRREQLNLDVIFP